MKMKCICCCRWELNEYEDNQKERNMADKESKQSAQGLKEKLESLKSKLD